MTSTLNLTAADGFQCPAYVARPTTSSPPKGAIVVLQEIFGVNAHIRAVADGFAAQGYVAIAPATFHRVQAGVELGYSGDDMAAGMALKSAVEALASPAGDPVTPLVLHDVQAAIDHARQYGKVGIVGYCWGGLLTWRAACLLQGLSAAVAYYGGGMTSPDEAARVPLCSVLAHFGEKDHWITLPSVQAFAQAQPGVAVHTYAADHGFNCDHRGAFDAPSSALALQRSLAFFAEQLG